MPSPSRAEAVAVLAAWRPSPRLLRHSVAVAEVASFLAMRMEANGVEVDRGVVEAAALLHDIDKALPASDPLKALGHGHAGAEWLARHGHPELARSVADHPVTRLTDDEAYRRWAAFAGREARIVAYADKRALQRVVSMDQRFERWQRRHPDMGPGLATARKRADRLEEDVCRAAGIRPTDVRRLRWVADAMAGAAG